MMGWQEGAMAYREVGMMEVKEVLRLWLGLVPQTQIAQLLGVDRKTVRRYTRLGAEHGLVPGLQVGDALSDERLAPILVSLKSSAGRPHGDGWERCVEQRTFIEDKLHGAKLSKVRRLLVRNGIVIPYSTLHRFAVTELGYGRRSGTIPVADGEPGSEVQLDTAWVGALTPDLFGKRRRFRAWIFTPVLSRHRFVWPVFRETTETAIEACEEAWDYYGGIFHVLIPDNTKTIVDQADPLGARINATFLEYAQARGFHIDPARSRSPMDKPRVERGVQSVRDDCFAGEQLQDLANARSHAYHWCTDEYGIRRHSSTRRMPREHFETEEKPKLLPAPTERYDTPRWCEPKVGRDQHAQVDRALYSLPHPYVGKKLRARADRSTVRFYHDTVIVKTHPRVLPGSRSTDPNDFPQEKTAYAMRDIDFLKRQAESHGEHIGQLAAIILDGPLPWTRMRRVYALLSLVRKYGDKRVDEACGTALDFEMHDVRRLQRMLKNGAALPPITRPESTKVIPLARYLRPASQYALPLVADESTTNQPTQGDD
jgi:hypothetical protein